MLRYRMQPVIKEMIDNVFWLIPQMAAMRHSVVPLAISGTSECRRQLSLASQTPRPA